MPLRPLLHVDAKWLFDARLPAIEGDHTVPKLPKNALSPRDLAEELDAIQRAHAALVGLTVEGRVRAVQWLSQWVRDESPDTTAY